MSTKPHTPSYTVQNCTFNSKSGKVSPATAEALKALAQASERHADALLAMAKALQGPAAAPYTGLHIGNVGEQS